MAVVAHADCAKRLSEIFHRPFNGCRDSAFRISREDMIRITGRPVFHKTSVDDVADLLVPFGLALVDRDSFFVVVMIDAFLEVTPLCSGEALLTAEARHGAVDGDNVELKMHTPKECARLLAGLFLEHAKLHDGGGFRISRKDLVRVTGRPIIHQTIIEDIGDWLVEQGLILVDRDSYFVVLHHGYFSGVRWAEEDVLKEYAEEPGFGEPGAVAG